MRANFFRRSLFIISLSTTALFGFGWLKTPHSVVSAQSENQITQGTLQSVDPSGKVKAVCPLKHTDVKAQISGFLSRVTVTQEFENPFKEKIEAVYTFP